MGFMREAKEREEEGEQVEEDVHWNKEKVERQMSSSAEAHIELSTRLRRAHTCQEMMRAVLSYRYV